MSPSRVDRPAVPEIIAHRGASRAFRENTLPAFAHALALGVDGIELDVHATSDGVLVVHHDPDLPVGAARCATPIDSMTAAELSAIRHPSGEQVPTLAEVFELVGDRATVYVEVKAAQVERLVAAMLDRFAGVRTAVHAFDHRIPVGVRGLRPATPIGLLSASYPLSLPGVLDGSGAEAFWQHADLIDASLVHNAHAAGVRVIAWTVNSAPHARRLAAWGVDALCTDIPDEIRRAVS
ncbi:glycerophosphodiester phosphodiesterase [Gemmatimonas sp.]|jgi:glycerophosphoryl diester phosphodiesterase|uniref:glycerophosphodiester phosphodiesterase n=1 Tax=Gemmatimonas sp. TaxID=1962908 RepID=UPI0037C14719